MAHKSNIISCCCFRSRLNEILVVNNLICRYVNTSDNPADLASRGCSFSELVHSNLWWNGPSWLRLLEFPVSLSVPEYRFDDKANVCINEVVMLVKELEQPVIDINRFSSWSKLVNTTCYVVRFLKLVSKNKFKLIVKVDAFYFSSNRFSVKEVRCCKMLIFLLAQRLTPPVKDEIDSLNLFKDKFGMFRCKGRICNSLLSENSKYPVWLPNKSRFTRLYLFYVHLSLLHAGPVVLFRLNFWVPQGRRLIRSVIREYCLICKKLSVGSYSYPPMPFLPESRVQSKPVFSSTGVDYSATSRCTALEDIQVKRTTHILTLLVIIKGPK